MPWGVAAAAVAAGGAIASADASRSAADKASDASLQGAQSQIQFQQKALDQATSLNAPYVQAGGQALGQLQNYLNPNSGAAANFNPANIPGLNFAMQQGSQAVENSGAARGTQLSGNTLQSLQGYSQGLASQGFNQYLSQLAGVAGMGQASANNTAIAGGNLLTSMGQASNSGITGAGAAQAAGGVGQSNAFTGAAGGLANNFIQQQTLSSLLNSQNPGTSGTVTDYGGGGNPGQGSAAYYPIATPGDGVQVIR